MALGLAVGAFFAAPAPAQDPEEKATATPAPTQTAEEEAMGILENDSLPAETRRDLLQKLANSNPGSAEVWSAYGEALEETGDASTAFRAYSKATELDSNYYTPWYRMGVLAKRGMPKPDYQRAEVYFRRAMKAGGPKAETLNQLAFSRAMQGDMEGAAKAWQDAIREDPQWGVLYSNLIKAALRLGDEEMVERYLPGAIAAERFEESAVLQYGDYLVSRGDEEEAITLYDKAIARHPGVPNLHFYRGLALEQAGRDTEAIKSLRKAGELAEANGQAAKIGQAVEFEIFRIKNPGDEEDFQEARRRVFGKYDDSKDLKKAMRKAVKELNPLIEKHPDFWNGYFIRGVALRRLNETEQAQADLRKVLELQPGEPNATMELALLLRDLYEFEKAAELADKAVELAPRDPLFAVNAGLIMIEVERCERAWELYRRAVKMVGEENARVLKEQLEIRCAQ